MSLKEHEYLTLKRPSEGEFKDKGSRFIGYARCVESEEQARSFLDEVKKMHHKARHHCYAWKIGHGEPLERSGDDGEPSGTAGRPILGQIHAFGLHQVAVIVVRYFGGVKLGTSGLIQAYREAARAALANAETEVREVLEKVKLTVDYTCAHYLLDAVKKHEVTLLEVQYTDHAEVILGLPGHSLEKTLLILKSEALQMPLEMAREHETNAWEVTFLGIS